MAPKKVKVLAAGIRFVSQHPLRLCTVDHGAKFFAFGAVGRRGVDLVNEAFFVTDLFILRGAPDFIRSDNGPDFVVLAVRDWIAAVGTKTAYIQVGSPLENGYCEIFYSLREAQILIERWRYHYNTVRPYSALGTVHLRQRPS
jgi:putative transposase